jgi:hypothetical protein
MKNSIFCDITQCGVGGKQSCSRNQRENKWQAELALQAAMVATCFHADFLLCLFFDPEDEGDMFLRNVR